MQLWDWIRLRKNPKVDSALHILKGAVQKVLGAKITASTYCENDEGRLTVVFDRKPLDEEMKLVEAEANNKIKENVIIQHFEMGRKEAEEKFGTIIYDKFAVPEHITLLKIVQIADWNINCCIGNHEQTTETVGQIIVRKYRFRNAKQELEISFSVV